jgi:hypothetical protein
MIKKIPSILAMGLLFAGLNAEASDSLDLARQFEQAGVPALALARVERDQPKPDDPDWVEWEALRLTLLYETNRPKELIAQVQGLPANLPRDFLQKAYGHGAWAYLEQGEGLQAKDMLARLLWQFDLSPKEQMSARRMLIDADVQAGQINDAYLSMLRYQQDFQPLDQGTTASFVESLLNAGKTAEAATWVAALDPDTPLSLLGRLKAGVVTPEAAITEAQEKLQKKNNPEFWAVVRDAAGMTKNRESFLAAQEQLLNLKKPGKGLFGVNPSALWKSYLDEGEAAGNRYQLLLGDDTSWLLQAQQITAESPAVSRAIYAFVSVRGSSPDSRTVAATQLMENLLGNKLGLAALRLFQAVPELSQNPGITPQIQSGLGEAAMANGDFKTAAGLWHFLTVPPDDVGNEDWQIQRAEVFAKASMPDEAVDTLTRQVLNQPEVSPEDIQHMTAIGRVMLKNGQTKSAEILFDRILPLMEPSERIPLLRDMAKAAEARHEPLVAADYDMQIALLGDADPKSGMAIKGRVAAAANLEQAGKHGDAAALTSAVKAMEAPAKVKSGKSKTAKPSQPKPAKKKAR